MFLDYDSTGEETDCETGLSYFGARYYDPTLLTTFLSIDRYADKYPNLSPYHYCAWNPIKLVDPSGDSVSIYGTNEQKTQAIEWLNQSSNNISYSLNENGNLVGSLKQGKREKDLHFNEKRMLTILGDYQNNVRVDLQNFDEIESDYQIKHGAQWNGTTIFHLDEKTQIITGNQIINLSTLTNDQMNSDCPRLAGLLISHEICEGYESCLLSRTESRALSPRTQTAGRDYKKCHENANLYYWGDIILDPNTNKICFDTEKYRL